MHQASKLVAVVTGAGRGIGAETARALAQEGFHVVLVSRTEAELITVQSSIEHSGGSAELLACDITLECEVIRLFETVPVVHLVVNNAGMNRPGELTALNTADLDAMLALNIRAQILVAREAVRKMVELPQALREQGVVSLVQVTSQMGRVGAAERTIYCATKHAMEGFTKALAIELAPYGVRVNAVAPTFLDTPLTAPFFAKDPAFRASVLRRIPMGRLGTVAEVASVIAFLASPAARFVTGESIAVDGGWTAQ